VIYQLNNETHWEISPEVMREVVKMLDERLSHLHPSQLSKLGIGLSNLRGAFECELMRLAKKAPETDPNADLLG
jgi:hypothetical protein